MRAALLPGLVWLMWRHWMPARGRTWLKDLHSRVLAKEMAARKAKGIQELKMGIYDMTQEELDEHAKRF